MKLVHPSELKRFLQERGIHLSKKLSQNFLIDENIVRKFVDAADLQEGDFALEIGPGAGAITDALLEKKGSVTAVEKDARFADWLSSKPGLTLILGDFLELDLDSLPKGKVLSNLPFQITAPILEKLLPRYEQFSTLTLIVQEEVAMRIMASPKTKLMGSFTIFCRFYADCRKLFSIGPQAFFPSPSVGSCVIQLTLRKPPFPSPHESFFRLVRTAYSKRRKMLRQSLSSLFSKEELRGVWERCSISPKSRPEDLSLEDWLLLHRSFETNEQPESSV